MHEEFLPIHKTEMKSPLKNDGLMDVIIWEIKEEWYLVNKYIEKYSILLVNSKSKWKQSNMLLC